MASSFLAARIHCIEQWKLVFCHVASQSLFGEKFDSFDIIGIVLCLLVVIQIKRNLDQEVYYHAWINGLFTFLTDLQLTTTAFAFIISVIRTPLGFLKLGILLLGAVCAVLARVSALFSPERGEKVKAICGRLQAHATQYDDVISIIRLLSHARASDRHRATLEVCTELHFSRCPAGFCALAKEHEDQKHSSKLNFWVNKLYNQFQEQFLERKDDLVEAITFFIHQAKLISAISV